jgi:hypothetical protein
MWLWWATPVVFARSHDLENQVVKVISVVLPAPNVM